MKTSTRRPSVDRTRPHAAPAVAILVGLGLTALVVLIPLVILVLSGLGLVGAP